jgi:hypothetical protein
MDLFKDFGGHAIVPTVDENDKWFIVRSDGDIAVPAPFNSAVGMEIVVPGKIKNLSTIAVLNISVALLQVYGFLCFYYSCEIKGRFH